MKDRVKDMKDLTERFFQIENELDLYNFRIREIYIWDLVRRFVFNELSNRLRIGKKSSKSNLVSPLSFFNLFINLFLSVTFKNPFLANKKEILFFGHSRRKFSNNKWTDIYCDEILKNISTSFTYWEKPYGYKHFRPTEIKSIKYLDYVYILGGLARKLFYKSVKFSDDEREEINKVEEGIYKEFKIRINLAEIFAKTIVKRNVHYCFLKRLLRKVRPKLAILLVSSERETFIEVCKVLGIKTIELQHGIIDKYHLGYSYPNNGTKRAFPDYFFTFGDFWNKAVDLPIEKDKVVSVGYPYFEKESSKYRNSRKKNQILFLSQGTIGRELSRLAVEFINKESELDYERIYKLHPGEFLSWKEDYPWLLKEYKKGNITVIDENITPLYKLMAESKIHIGVYSTAIYEGLVFNPSVYLLNTSGIEYMEKLINSGYAKKIDTAEDLLKDFKYNSGSLDLDSSFFFKEESIKNIQLMINRILEK